MKTSAGLAQDMWGRKGKLSGIACTECGARLPANAEICGECSYPVTAHAREANEVTQATIKEYRLIQILGGAVIAGGLIAAAADSPIAAAVSITIGIATYITGLLGAWWNTGN
ncbi:hypothetical protein [Noviherbaspirillum sp.]|uniref:hypothetical protein n=1 Tax=Noviherbaspirillum sp. TaxID=1926288 RepID=UPI0025FC4B3E|nr:hypothetical protein [Noviherbaspirillum sp.]